MGKGTCAVECCGKPAKSRGWCSAHYERWRRTGVLGDCRDGRARPEGPCLVDGCAGNVMARGWCGKHYARWKQHGDPLHARQYGGTRSVTDNGYIRVWAPTHPLADRTGMVAEHRKVAWDAGLLTDRALLVHHRNHDRTDNRLENLQVKSNAEHASEHNQERGTITNQFGTWTLRSLRTNGG